jgi:hypothetical protein
VDLLPNRNSTQKFGLRLLTTPIPLGHSMPHFAEAFSRESAGLDQEGCKFGKKLAASALHGTIQ